MRTSPGPWPSPPGTVAVLFFYAFSLVGDGDANPPIRALREKAGPALSDAEHLLENGSVEAAINRGSDATLQAARAALRTGEESPKTRSGVIRRFGYYFI
jgi:uncharacterized protein (UPF0332 family)